ncbi:MAG TPA: hypothetical protein VFP50_05090 [Anaeromyxobacteraceae bacterium]|nr:hypothetical protein [Anaeromyxobacteraceae bacterium]
MRGALLAALLAAAFAASACGVKAPPKPAGAPEKEPPHEIFRPGEERR